VVSPKKAAIFFLLILWKKVTTRQKQGQRPTSATHGDRCPANKNLPALTATRYYNKKKRSGVNRTGMVTCLKIL
jgi:hypothetical protein